MVDLMNLSDQVDKDFSIARRRARMRGLGLRFSGRFGGGTLLPFEERRRALGAAGGIRLGRRTVPLSGVVGSVGQHDRFDTTFMPLRGASPERWKRVDRAFRTGVDLQPVSLYSLDGAYFVDDGHNRVSVARFHGAEWIDAEVTEFRRLRRGDRGFRVSWPSTEDHSHGRISMQEHKMWCWLVCIGPETGD